MKRGNTYSSLENTLVTPVHLTSLAHFILASFGVHDAVLAGNLVAVTLAERALLGLVVAQLPLEFGLDMVDLLLLQALEATGGLGSVIGEELQLIPDAGIESLGVGDDALEILGGYTVVGLGEGTLV